MKTPKNKPRDLISKKTERVWFDELSMKEVEKVAIKSIEEGGADSICFGCMALNDHADKLSKRLSNSHPGVIVINPGKAVIKIAELLVELGLTQSKRSYPRPPKEVNFIF